MFSDTEIVAALGRILRMTIAAAAVQYQLRVHAVLIAFHDYIPTAGGIGRWSNQLVWLALPNPWLRYLFYIHFFLVVIMLGVILIIPGGGYLQ